SWFTAGNWTPSGVPTTISAINIANGGTCTTGGGASSAASVSIRGGSTHDLLGTLACNSGGGRVGESGGSGLLFVRDGGVVNAFSLLVGADAGSAGTLRIGNGGLPGTVNAPVSNVGPGQVEFNHTSSSYTFARPLRGSLGVSHQAGTTTLSSPSS